MHLHFVVERLFGRRVRKTRQPAQNVIEFGTGIAAVAFVALVGFTALGNAQQTYWGVVSNSPVMVAPTPAPGDFLHPTRVDTPFCGTPQPLAVLLGGTLTCNPPVVHDIYSDTNERRFPQGTVELWLDGAPIPSSYGGPVSCTLSASSGSDTNACSTQLVWNVASNTALLTPPASPRVHTLSLNYTPALSNHSSSQSSSINVTILPNYQFSAASCVVEGTSSNRQDAGHPVTCTVHVVDASNGNAPVDGIDVTWQTVPGGGSGSGAPLLTCATGDSPRYSDPAVLGSTLYSTTQCASGQSLICTTGSGGVTGACSVVYRREPDVVGNLSQGIENLAVSMFSMAPVPVPGTSGTISLDPPSGTNNAQSWLSACTVTGGSASVSPGQFQIPSGIASRPGQIPPIFAVFNMAAGINVSGLSVSLRCQPQVADATASTATVCTNDPSRAPGGTPPWCGQDPDRFGAFAPAGMVTWELDGTPIQVGGVPLTCTLTPTQNLAPQARNGPPFASNCTALNLTINVASPGTHSLAAVYSGPTHVVYDGDPSSGFMPTHNGAYQVPIVFN